MESDEFDNSDPIQTRKMLRRLERKMRKEHRRMSLEQELIKRLPSSLIPGNVGNLYDVAWPFNYTINFDFGVDPTYGPATRQVQSFQNTQEAAFILGGMTRKSYAYSTSGELAPLNLLIKDRQSTRQFMDVSIPLQAIAKKTPYTIFEVPLVIMPNAFIDVIMSSWLTADQATTGSGRHDFTFIGYRTRTSDIGTVLSTVFGS
jgi:hypothetical protein